MQFLTLVKSSIKQISKERLTVFIVVVIPLFVALLLATLDKTQSKISCIAVINSDNGSYSEVFLKEIGKEYAIKFYEKEEGIEDLKKKAINVCYEIPEHFSEEIEKGDKVALMSYKIEKENGKASAFEMSSNRVLNRMVLVSRLKKAGVNVAFEDIGSTNDQITMAGKEVMSVMDGTILHFIISFIFFNAISIGNYLFKLKKEHIYQRSLTTANSKACITGSILAALFVFLFISFTMAYLVQGLIRQSLSLEVVPFVIANIAIAVLISLSIGLIISRICQNEMMINLTAQIIAWVTCFIGGSFAPLEFLPKVVRYLARFTPQYWILTSITEKSMGALGVAFLFAFFLLVCSIGGKKQQTI